ncbi:MAG TPA: hypothetical protein VFQ80_07950, partial [Thermomicrobiales bacterium]|nr:hypothetical protein [Thermomicrobiales bacterium]
MEATIDRAMGRADGRAARKEPTAWLDGGQRVALMRIGFGLIWAIDAWYKWRPAFLTGFGDEISRPLQSAPAPLQPWLLFWQNLLSPHAMLFAVATALLETLIAVCLILGLARRPIYVVGAAFSFLIWAVPESFGRIWQTGQTDIGTSIIYVFIFLALLVVDTGANAGGWSLD